MLKFSEGQKQAFPLVGGECLPEVRVVDGGIEYGYGWVAGFFAVTNEKGLNRLVNAVAAPLFFKGSQIKHTSELKRWLGDYGQFVDWPIVLDRVNPTG